MTAPGAHQRNIDAAVRALTNAAGIPHVCAQCRRRRRLCERCYAHGLELVHVVLDALDTPSPTS